MQSCLQVYIRMYFLFFCRFHPIEDWNLFIFKCELCKQKCYQYGFDVGVSYLYNEEAYSQIVTIQCHTILSPLFCWVQFSSRGCSSLHKLIDLEWHEQHRCHSVYFRKSSVYFRKLKISTHFGIIAFYKINNAVYIKMSRPELLFIFH